MTRSIEDVARSFLLRNFTHAIYSFSDKRSGDKGFDLWLTDKEKKTQQKIELKAHSGIYQRPCNLVERLIFNADIERQLFEQGETVIARVFLGSQPYKVFIITNAILASGAMLRSEARYVLRGHINYEKSFTQLA